MISRFLRPFLQEQPIYMACLFIYLQKFISPLVILALFSLIFTPIFWRKTKCNVSYISLWTNNICLKLRTKTKQNKHTHSQRKRILVIMTFYFSLLLLEFKQEKASRKNLSGSEGGGSVPRFALRQLNLGEPPRRESAGHVRRHHTRSELTRAHRESPQSFRNTGLRLVTRHWWHPNTQTIPLAIVPSHSLPRTQL